MRTILTLATLGLTGLFIFCGVKVNGQTTNSNSNVKSGLIGMWGMFKDKHPDGWGSFNPPYMYFEFMEDNKYSRTNGIEKGIVKGDTVKLYSIKSDLMEIWEDWDRILSKRIKKWGHKQKYRPLTNLEKEKLVAVKTQLMNDYSLLKDTEEKKDN